MRVGTALVLGLLLCLGAVRAALGSEAAALAEAINAYRSLPQACAGRAWDGLPPLSVAEGRQLLALINQARVQPRDCGGQRFAAAPPLVWNAQLASAAEAHSRAMASGDFFGHVDPQGHTPGDRAELAGYPGGLIGENIAAGLGSGRKVLDGWLASPAHCANLMNAQFRELGAGYASDPQSAAGIYWTALFGAP